MEEEELRNVSPVESISTQVFELTGYFPGSSVSVAEYGGSSLSDASLINDWGNVGIVASSPHELSERKRERSDIDGEQQEVSQTAMSTLQNSSDEEVVDKKIRLVQHSSDPLVASREGTLAEGGAKDGIKVEMTRELEVDRITEHEVHLGTTKNESDDIRSDTKADLSEHVSNNDIVSTDSAPASTSSTARVLSSDNKNESSCSAMNLTYQLYTNTGSDESFEALITLKNIFGKQLPKMPKDYIVRLVFDRRHYTLAIKRDNRIIGGICYRPYLEQRFGEIAFLAISGTEQVKGFGTILMNNLKAHVQQQGLEYFLTYADNYAIGYFQKQGFSKIITMPKDRWVGYIKDYDGGTLMECYIHPAFDYLNATKIVAKQREFIYRWVVAHSQSAIVNPGMSTFTEGKRVHNILDVPGVLSGGWTVKSVYGGTTERDRNNTQIKLTKNLRDILDRMLKESTKNPARVFYIPADHIMEFEAKYRNPISLSTIEARLREGDYYRSRNIFCAELLRLIEQYKGFFAEGSEQVNAVLALETQIAINFPETSSMPMLNNNNDNRNRSVGITSQTSSSCETSSAIEAS